MAFQPVVPITTYGATRTTTFTTTITAVSNQGIFTNMLFPSPPMTESLKSTTLPSPTDSASKYYPSPLPILVVTDAVTVILNSNGLPISTGTLVETPPVQPTTPPFTTAHVVTPICSSWNCWTPGQRAGTASAIVFFVIAIIGLIWWGFFSKPRDRGNSVRVEQDLESGRDASQRPRRRTGSRRTGSTTSSFSSSSNSSRQVPMQQFPPTRPRPSSRANGKRGRSAQGQYPRAAQVLYDPRQPSATTGVNVRDFAIPVAAGLAAAGLGAAAAVRASTPPSRRPSVRERSTSRHQSVERAHTQSRSKRRDDGIFRDRPQRTDTKRDRPRARR